MGGAEPPDEPKKLPTATQAPAAGQLTLSRLADTPCFEGLCACVVVDVAPLRVSKSPYSPLVPRSVPTATQASTDVQLTPLNPEASWLDPFGGVTSLGVQVPAVRVSTSPREGVLGRIGADGLAGTGGRTAHAEQGGTEVGTGFARKGWCQRCPGAPGQRFDQSLAGRVGGGVGDAHGHAGAGCRQETELRVAPVSPEGGGAPLAVQVPSDRLSTSPSLSPPPFT